MRNYQAPPVVPSIRPATIASSGEERIGWAKPIGLIVIQNETAGNICIQTGRTTYEGTLPADHIVKSGETRSYAVYCSDIVVYNAGAAAARLVPSVDDAHNETLLITGYEAE